TLAGMAYDVEHQVTVLFGGSVNSVPSNETWTWNGTAWTHLMPATTPTAIYSQAMVYDPVRKRVVMTGGVDPTGNHSVETWEWDAHDWTLVSSAAPGVRDAASGYDPIRHRVVLFSGVTQTMSDDRDTWEWDGNTWTKLDIVTSPASRIYGRIAWNGPRHAFE